MNADVDASFFWRNLSEGTLGKHLDLDKFYALVDIAVKAICLSETGDKEKKLAVSYLH